MPCADCAFFVQMTENGKAHSTGLGTCRIRSTPGSFPLRMPREWCNEYVPTSVPIRLTPPLDKLPPGEPDPRD